MRVLLVHNFYQEPGGEDQVFAEEFALLEKYSHTVRKFTVHNDAIKSMGKLEAARKTLWNPDTAKPLQEAIRAIDAQVVHFHNTFPLISPAAYYAAHEVGAAVVQTLHNYRVLCPSATFYRDGKVCEDCLGKMMPWPAVVHKCYRDNRLATATLAGMLTFHHLKGTWKNEVDVYIALTEFGKGKLIAGGLPAEKIEVKTNFVDPDPGPGNGEGGYAVVVGRLAEGKGILTLLEAWKTVHAKTGAIVKIIGDGPLRAEVEQAAKQGFGIEYVGRRASAEVYAMMGDARMLVFPARWYEGQPRTIVEALAKGTPVIAPRHGPMPDLVDDRRTGLLFEPGSAVDLADKTIALFSD
ncbi:MAG TPA: glycosyltransferase family 4 protein, partial [Candidatus Acidoferrum sp.]|nr:glycosyltransferase family 4 protein [Candidatus Acidoferrum sp.]